MSEDSQIFTESERRTFKIALKSKFRTGVRTPINILYIFMTLIGVGWATWAIPVLNKASITPETIGIYIIGFLITVWLDALLILKKTADDNKVEQTISVLIMIFSTLLIIASSILSLKSFPENSNLESEGSWKCYAYYIFPIILIVAILMSVVLTGFDAEKLHVGPLDMPENSIANRNPV